jgi:hypothetical protein
MKTFRPFHAAALRCACALALCLGASAGEAELADTIRAYDAEHDSVARFYPLSWSQVRGERLATLARSWQETLAAADFAALGQAGRVDWLLLRERLAYDLGKLHQERARVAQVGELVPFRGIVEELELARWRSKPVDPAAASAALAGVPEQLRQLRARLDQGRKDAAATGTGPAPLKPTPVLAQRAARLADGVREALKGWYEAYAGATPGFAWWMKQPCEEIDKGLEDYAKFLREELAGLKGKDEDPLLGEALGAAGLARDLAVEFLPYSADELLAIGEREFAWCEARMREAAGAMKLGDDWHAALARVKEQQVPPGKQGDYIAEQAAAAIAFVKSRDLVTVPALCEETWRIKMISSDAQKQLPYVAYDGMNVLAAYARDDMSANDKLMCMRGNNRHFTRLTTAHELIPGHHLQAYFAQRFRAYRSVFWTPFLVEGWALYWEMALWDQGYARSPEDQVGMLFWRMHRAARIIVTLKFHLGQLTPAQMVDFLVERVGHERLGATSEVRRYISGDYSPLYQCGYLIGGLQLRALAKEATAGGAMTVKQFNDAVLRYGPIPVEMIRAGLRDVPLTRESRAQWRFDG